MDIPASQDPRISEQHDPAGATADVTFGDLETLPVEAAATARTFVSTRVCERPCGPCPFKRSNAGKFSNLADYAAGTIPGRTDFGHDETSDPPSRFGILFSCHRADTTVLCAGHVATVGMRTLRSGSGYPSDSSTQKPSPRARTGRSSSNATKR